MQQTAPHTIKHTIVIVLFMQLVRVRAAVVFSLSEHLWSWLESKLHLIKLKLSNTSNCLALFILLFFGYQNILSRLWVATQPLYSLSNPTVTCSSIALQTYM